MFQRGDGKMSKKSTTGTCALCKRKNIALMQSHIIPKLVYSRVKTYQNSRFRNYFDFNQLFQDGEKKPMLCHECEEFFSKYEVAFTNRFLDKYLKMPNRTLPHKDENIKNYIITVAWRIMYDDLFVYDSFESTHIRMTYETLEKRLRKYLNQIRTDNITITTDIIKNNPTEDANKTFGERIAAHEETMYNSTLEQLEHIETFIFTLKELGYSNEIVKLLDAFIFGYCFNTSDHKKYVIFSSYKGLVIATVFWNNKCIFIPSNVKEFLKSLQTKRALKVSLKEEIDYILIEIKKSYPVNQEILNANNTREKIAKRYENSKKL